MVLKESLRNPAIQSVFPRSAESAGITWEIISKAESQPCPKLLSQNLLIHLQSSLGDAFIQ